MLLFKVFNIFNCGLINHQWHFFKGIFHTKKKTICRKHTHPHTMQDVEEFDSSLEQIWIHFALHHLLTNGSSTVNGCHQNANKTADKYIHKLSTWLQSINYHLEVSETNLSLRKYTKKGPSSVVFSHQNPLTYKRVLDLCIIISLLNQMRLPFHWRKQYFSWKQMFWSYKSLNGVFDYYKHSLFLRKILNDGLESSGLLWCFYQLFGLSLWRHPFTVEDPLVSKWCNTKFLQICSSEDTNSTTFWMVWGRVILQQFFIFGWTIPLT